MRICLFFWILALYCIFTIKGSVNFEKHIWTFWNDPIQQAPLMMRLCYQKIKIVCQQQGYNFTLLSSVNVKNYITNFEQFQYHVKNRKLYWIQSVADLVRVTVLEQHGGIWLDITSILMNGLKWIDKIQQKPQLITNRNPSLNKSPDMMLFYVFLYQNSNEQRNEDGGIVNILPGFQNWFIAAKKNSRVISLWKKYFSEFLITDFQITMQKLSYQNIYIRGADNDGLYLSMHKAIYYMMQKQQLQLDKKLTLFSKRQNVNNYLNIWGLHGQYGPLSVETKILSSALALLNKEKQQLKQDQFQLKFYLKMTYSCRWQIDNQINKIKDLVKSGRTFQQFLAGRPSHQQCSNYQFIVDGSVVAFLMKDNPVANELNLFTITKQQRSRWRGYCFQLKNNLPQSNFSLSQLANFFESYFAIDVQISSQLSLDARENLKFYQNALESQREGFYQFFFISRYNKVLIKTAALMISCLTFVLGIGPLFGQILKRIISKKYKKEKSIMKIEQKNQIKKNVLNYLTQLFSFFLYVACIINGYRLSFTKLTLGFFDQQLIVLASITISYYSIKKYQQVCNPQKRIPIFISALNNREFLNASFPIFCLYIGNSIVFGIQKRPEKIVAISTSIFLVLPTLIKLGKGLSSKILQNQIPINILLKFILKYDYFNLIFVFGWIILIILIPNIKYLANQNGYLSHNVINVAILYMCTVYLAVFIQIANKCKNKIWLQNILKQMSAVSLNCFIILSRIITSFIITSFLICMSYSIYFQPHNEQIFKTKLYARYESTIILVFMCINLLISYQSQNQTNQSQQFVTILKYKHFIFSQIMVGCALIAIGFPYFYHIFYLIVPKQLTSLTRIGLVVFSILILVWNRVIRYLIDYSNKKSNQFYQIANDQQLSVLAQKFSQLKIQKELN